MAENKAAVAKVSDEQIRAIAHKLWVDAGKPEGQAEDHWFKALELASVKAGKAAKAAKAKTIAKPAEKAASRPAGAKPAAKKPAAKKPAAKKPAATKPAATKPAAKKPAAKQASK